MIDRRRLKHALESVGFRALLGVVRALPPAAVPSLATGLGRFTFDLVRIRRDVAVRNVLVRIDPPGGRGEAERIARESYAVMARTFLGLIRMDRMDDTSLWRSLSREEFAWVGALQSSGEGGLLVSGHFGNWELVALGIRRMGVPVRALAADQANPRVDAYLKEIRARAGIPTLSARHGLRDALDTLRRGGFLATLMDQDARRKGIFVNFLGTPSASHTGVVAMSLHTGAPLVPGVLIDDGGTYRFVRGEVWRPDPGVSREENLRSGVEHFHRFLEEQVRAHPENYFWAHRRWKTRPASPEGRGGPAAPAGDGS